MAKRCDGLASECCICLRSCAALLLVYLPTERRRGADVAIKLCFFNRRDQKTIFPSFSES